MIPCIFLKRILHCEFGELNVDGVVLLDHLLYVREESYPKVKFQPAAFFIWKIYAKEDLG